MSEPINPSAETAIQLDSELDVFIPDGSLVLAGLGLGLEDGPVKTAATTEQSLENNYYMSLGDRLMHLSVSFDPFLGHDVASTVYLKKDESADAGSVYAPTASKRRRKSRKFIEWSVEDKKVTGQTTTLYGTVKEIVQAEAEARDRYLLYTFMTREEKLREWAPTIGNKIFDWTATKSFVDRIGPVLYLFKAFNDDEEAGILEVLSMI